MEQEVSRGGPVVFQAGEPAEGRTGVRIWCRVAIVAAVVVKTLLVVQELGFRSTVASGPTAGVVKV